MEENTKRMLAGKPYCPATAELDAFAHFAHRLCRDYTLTTDEDTVERTAIIEKLFPNHGASTYIQGPMFVDYGRFTTLGDNFYANANLTILDTCPVTIGDNVMCGPNVSIITAMHPLRYQQRNPRQLPDGRFADYEYGKPVTIGSNCWLAAKSQSAQGSQLATAVSSAQAPSLHRICRPTRWYSVFLPRQSVKSLKTIT